MREGLDVEEAQDWILGVTPVLAAERVPVQEALDRVLAEPVVSTRTLPPADCSAMDGYAVRRADLEGASAGAPVELPVVFEVPAGHPPERSLRGGEAARIFTGGALPQGADAVVRQEDSEAAGIRVRIRVAPEPREHVRDAGEDLRVGERVLAAGRVVGPAEIGVLVSLGRTQVAVHQRPRVAILSGGDELVEPDGDPAEGRIVSSNSYTLAAQCREVGAESVYLGIARDTRDDVEGHFRAGLRADCIVSSAGVSVGEYDFVREVLEKLGCPVDFWGVHMKPGFPVAFGRFGREPGGERLPLVFGLPGNPVSAMVSFEQFVRPALRRMAGRREPFRATLRARVGEPLRKRAGRLHFHRVQLERREGEWWAVSTGSQSSGVLTSMTAADGLLVFPKDATELEPGGFATVQVLAPGFHDSAERGF